MLETQILVIALLAVALLSAAVWYWRRPPPPVRRAATTPAARPLAPVAVPAAPPGLDTEHASLIVPGAQEVLAQLYSVAFDDADVAAAGQSPTSAHAPIVANAVAILNGIATQPRYTPRRPTQLSQLMNSLQEDDASLRAISRIVAQDPSLTGNLLRVANSPAYRVSHTPIESIERAITLIGTEGLRSMITAALLQPVLSGDSGAFSKFPEIIWEHTLFSASAAETHATMIEKSDAFAAQLLGLLQGLGSIIVFRVARDQYATRPDLAPDAAVIAGLLDAQSAATARRIAEGWQLSNRIIDALEDQNLQSNPELLSSLGRSLRFGRLAGGLIMLRKLGKLSETQARAALLASDSHATEVQKIWERMVRGHRLA
jgi:HD-like signal output (HDOD) protein